MLALNAEDLNQKHEDSFDIIKRFDQIGKGIRKVMLSLQRVEVVIKSRRSYVPLL